MKKSNYSKSVVISVSIHALFIMLLLWGADFSFDHKQSVGNTIQATMVDPAMLNQQAQQIRQQRQAAKDAEQARQDRLEQQTAVLEKQRKAEAERIRQLKEDKLTA